MATTTKTWSTGTGSVTIQYNGQGDGQLTITSDPNSLYEARSMQIKVKTTDDSIERIVTIQQAAKVRIDISTAVVTVSGTYTYSGAAKTPTPTVTLNGSTVPSIGYDVSYSDNINAGTATVTVTGKNEYTGSASGTFTINKASRTISFGNTYYVQNTSTTTTRTATPSAGSGDGAITYSISSTTYATINSSTGAVTSKTSDGSATVTATIAEGTNYLSASASYTLYVFATTHDYSYNGSYRSVTLPPGSYQFQVWGAQGGSNGTNSTYGITAKAGGKGGYSVGQLSVSQATGIRVYVGGQGSSSAGGYNGGGSTSGTSQYNSGDTFGYSKMGGGGGASDIRLSDGALLSRMIVAGGGSGGAMCLKRVTTSTTETVTDMTKSSYESYPFNNHNQFGLIASKIPVTNGKTYTLSGTGAYQASNKPYIDFTWVFYNDGVSYDDIVSYLFTGSPSVDIIARNSGTNESRWSQTAPNKQYCMLYAYVDTAKAQSMGYGGYEVFFVTSFTLSMTHQETHTSTSDTTDYQAGYVGGGTTGAGYSSTYKGKQNGAGSNGSFGQGANQSTTGYRYCSGAGGGGWYGGGGGQKSDSSMTYCKYSGGGSGFVNTAASAGNRPSGYTGLQLDSGETKAGNTSFPSTSGGTETGHSGNGYARITRLS